MPLNSLDLSPTNNLVYLSCSC